MQWSDPALLGATMVLAKTLCFVTSWVDKDPAVSRVPL